MKIYLKDRSSLEPGQSLDRLSLLHVREEILVGRRRSRRVFAKGLLRPSEEVGLTRGGMRPSQVQKPVQIRAREPSCFFSAGFGDISEDFKFL